MQHLAIPVTDQERSRSFYERYLGFDAQPPQRYDGGVLMLYDRHGFALALGPSVQPPSLPGFLHFGVHLDDPNDVRALAGQLQADGVDLVERWDEPDYVSVKFRDPDGYLVEAAWDRTHAQRLSPAP